MSPQTTRSQEYFRRAYILPFIDNSCIAQLDECFTRQKAAACLLCAFLPAVLNSRKYDEIGLAAKLYRQILLDGGLVALQTQFLQWQRY
jgi:hypothetical protein